MDIKTILITGASKGIGASFSNFLASEGYRIIGIARNKDQLIIGKIQEINVLI